ncbi:MAG TPA: FAD-binding monooxygenase [Hyphomicrobiaceae bacterium]|nr:FAD-binding monooxygenase [Hyphomicrobiaceae bacterium]
MQFHLNGFRPGDPRISEPSGQHATAPGDDTLPAEVDVLIVGCGPAGLTLAAQLAAFPGITTRIVEQKPGPLQLGQADGIACRTMEMFEAFGFAEQVLKEAHWIVETTFWKPDDANRENVIRHGRVQDVEDDLSEMPHVVLNQARVHDFYLETMRNGPNRLEPGYSRRLVDLQLDPALAAGGNSPSHPVTVRLERIDPAHEGTFETVRARYVVGCDGARSAVRQALGRMLHGDSANQAWGVMDVLAVTDFPDIRMKSLVQSASEGTLLVIPREGGYLVRIYVELDQLKANERVASRNITADDIIAAAQRILRPYTLEVKEVAWWSVYEIGQRLTDKFDDVPAESVATRTPRVFIAGDACHTHSPKAGQGMNVSMQDAFNLGWKLAAVLQGRCPPSFLHTYSAERQAIAKSLIDFDREWAAMLSAPHEEVDPAEVQRYFVQHGRYTAGTVTRYSPSILTGEAAHQHLAKGLTIGMRFHSAPVVRLADAKLIQLGHVARADGRWRLYAFSSPEDPTAPNSRIRALCDFLAAAPDSPVRRHTPANADIDSVIEVLAVFQQGHRDLRLEAMPGLLLPRKGRHGLRDYEKMYCPDIKGGNDIYDMRGIDRERGCVVVVRPDQYIAHVLPLGAHQELATFFAGFLLPQDGRA